MRLWIAGLGVAAVIAAGVAAPARADETLRAKGRLLYDTYCARCHGPDGSDTTLYPGVRSLVGLTNRLTAAEVVDKSRAFVTVNLDGEAGKALHAHLATFQPPRVAAGPLVETGWLAEHLNSPGLRIVDLRPEAEYRAGHIPGAVWLDERLLRSGEDPESWLPPPGKLSELFSGLGIGSGTRVVAYDAQAGRSATRLWFVLGALGHPEVSVLNGGWPKWKKEERPVSTEPPVVQKAEFRARPTPTLACPSTEVLARRPGVVVLDTRSEGEVRRGRIPGSIHVDWTENVTGDPPVFRPLDELRRLYASRGITPDKEIVAHCQTGGRASHTLFVLKLLGYPKVRLYYGSWQDYTGRGAPVDR